jgi:hypothetical protein
MYNLFYLSQYLKSFTFSQLVKVMLAFQLLKVIFFSFVGVQRRTVSEQRMRRNDL